MRMRIWISDDRVLEAERSKLLYAEKLELIEAERPKLLEVQRLNLLEAERLELVEAQRWRLLAIERWKRLEALKLKLRSKLIEAAVSFLISGRPRIRSALVKALKYYTLEEPVSVHEDAVPQFAPFLGRNFVGIHDVREHFATILSSASYGRMIFKDHIADIRSRQVSVRGQAVFTSEISGQSWNEIFIYVLDFDNEDRVKRYQIWADTGAAFIASRSVL